MIIRVLQILPTHLPYFSPSQICMLHRFLGSIVIRHTVNQSLNDEYAFNTVRGTYKFLSIALVL